MRTHYETLGIPETADADDIKTAYKREARLHHPDTNAGDGAAATRFKVATSAYDVLKDPMKKATYDSDLRTQRAWAQLAPQSPSQVLSPSFAKPDLAFWSAVGLAAAGAYLSSRRRGRRWDSSAARYRGRDGRFRP